MEKTTGCTCKPEDQFCERHGIKKTPHFYHLCSTNEKYFKLWEECRGPNQSFADCVKHTQSNPPPPPPTRTCGHCLKQQPVLQTQPTQEEVKANLPSVWQQAKNLGSALVEHAKNGFKKTPEDLASERLEICNQCPLLIRDSMRCGACGCYVASKVKMESSKCPKSYW